VLVGYRIHSGSDTARLGHSVGQLREMIRSVRISNGYLPGLQARRWTGHVYYVIRRWAREERDRALRGAAYGDALRYSATVVETTARLKVDRLLSRVLPAVPA
jgi:hypothetical protein